MLSTIMNRLRNQKGQGMVEYGLILGLVAIGAIGALTLMGDSVAGNFNTIVGSL